MKKEQQEAIDKAYRLLKQCVVCPRNCRVDRTRSEVGYCGMTHVLKISSVGPHFGEESCLVGSGGSGTIFLAGCNLLCIFCQNFDISHGRRGASASEEEVAGMMLDLERMGCHNINFVTPTHFAPQIMKCIAVARDGGLSVPIVYNSGGYDHLHMLKLLDGFIEIYMPDFKFWSRDVAERLANSADYPQIAKAAFKEMHRQVGDLVIENGIARRGLLVRHLVMPNNLVQSKEVIDFLSDEISPNTFVNVMGQYRPVYRAGEVREINRFPTSEEILQARRYAKERGLRLDR